MVQTKCFGQSHDQRWYDLPLKCTAGKQKRVYTIYSICILHEPKLEWKWKVRTNRVSFQNDIVECGDNDDGNDEWWIPCVKWLMDESLNPSRPNLGQKEKINLNFIFSLLCGTSRGFMMALKPS